MKTKEQARNCIPADWECVFSNSDTETYWSRETLQAAQIQKVQHPPFGFTIRNYYRSL